MGREKPRYLLIIFLHAFLIWGCREGGQAGERKKELMIPSEVSAELALLPVAPTAEDDLRLEITQGKAEVEINWRRNGNPLDQHKGILATGNFAKGDVVTVTVMDEGGERQASVSIRNTPPRVTGVQFSPGVFHRGVDIAAEVSGLDSDRDEISYRFTWSVNGKESSFERERTLLGDRFIRGDVLAVTVTPFDGETDGEAYRSSDLPVPNAPPVITTSPPAQFQADFFSYAVGAEDVDGDVLTFSLEESPTGMTIDSQSGEIVWRISPGTFGENRIRVVVQDTIGARAIQDFVLNLQKPK
jgi:hypothetical protein